jgi:hypothetical protein
MKPRLLVIIALLFSIKLHAQDHPASPKWMTGGSTGIFFQKERAGLHSLVFPVPLRPRWDDTRSRHLAVSGFVGRVYKPWWMIGVLCTYERSRHIFNTPVDYKRTSFYDLYSRESIFTMGLFSRFTINPKHRLQGYFQVTPLVSLSKASIGTSSEITEAHRDDWVRVAFSGGVRYRINRKTAAFLNVSGFDLLLIELNKLIPADRLSTDQFEFTFRPANVQIGMDYSF